MTRTVLEAEGKHYAVQKASIIQKLNTHAFLKTFFLCGEDTNRISCYSPVCLKECPDQPDQEKVLFCGIVTGMVRYQEEGRDYMELTAASGSILADLQRRECSFQQESRTYGELFRLILEKYPGEPISGMVRKSIRKPAGCSSSIRKVTGNFCGDWHLYMGCL
ncbi:MAG: hypothetical protein GX234_11385 [Clostridiales bacterium]|nr:hypothetical protein [Clostridiales bacterium]